MPHDSDHPANTPETVTVVMAGGPGSLIEIPHHLFGYQIADSLVLLGLRTAGHRVTHALRSDLPAPGEPLDDALNVQFKVLREAARAGITRFIAIAFGATDRTGPLTSAVLAYAQLSGISILADIQVDGDRYRLRTDSSTGARAAGSHPVAADNAVIGALGRREDLPTRAEAVAARRPRLEGPTAEMAAATQDARQWLDALGADDVLPAGRTLTRTAVARYRAGEELTVEETARLSLLLGDSDVAEDAAAQLTSGDSAPLCDLWWDLANRAAVNTHACLTLLAFSAYFYGDALLAIAAAEQALDLSPGYLPAMAIHDQLRFGEPPLNARWQPRGRPPVPGP